VQVPRIYTGTGCPVTSRLPDSPPVVSHPLYSIQGILVSLVSHTGLLPCGSNSDWLFHHVQITYVTILRSQYLILTDFIGAYAPYAFSFNEEYFSSPNSSTFPANLPSPWSPIPDDPTPKQLRDRLWYSSGYPSLPYVVYHHAHLQSSVVKGLLVFLVPCILYRGFSSLFYHVVYITPFYAVGGYFK
jgi:hypothetical protein